MQISSITSSSSFSLARTNSAPVQTQSSDQALINTTPDNFSSYVKEATAMPEVRSELVDAYKARVESGHYPSQEIVAGLTRLIGGGIVKLADTSSSSKN